MSEFKSEEEFLTFLKDNNKSDPLFSTKMGANHFLDELIQRVGGGGGVQVETLIAALASLGGFSCQMAARAQVPAPALTRAEGTDGKTYFFGDDINKYLIEDDYSYCNLVMAATLDADIAPFPNLPEIAAHVAGTVGSAEFGIPRIPPEHALQMMPASLVKEVWPMASEFLGQYLVAPKNWPIFFGIATQNAIEMGAEVLAPSMGFKIAVECAIPMSKINPDEYQLKSPVVAACPKLHLN